MGSTYRILTQMLFKMYFRMQILAQGDTWVTWHHMRPSVRLTVISLHIF